MCHLWLIAYIRNPAFFFLHQQLDICKANKRLSKHPPPTKKRIFHPQQTFVEMSPATASLSDDIPLNILYRQASLPQALLRVEKSKVENINVQPGQKGFVLWFVLATYLPLLTACLGPLANMTSVASLVSRWRTARDGTVVKDEAEVLAINSVSLFLGVVANVSLLSNFHRERSYKWSSAVSVICYSLASCVLLAGIGFAQVHYFVGEHYRKDSGFWFAVLTVILYFGCAIGTTLNYIGFLLGRYQPKLNLEHSERGLVSYTFLLAIWFLWGSWLFQHLLHINYAEALYWCCVSMLTIGLGDIVPTTDVGKGLAFTFSLSGIVIIGLIIAMIRGVCSSSSTPVFLWNRVEVERKKVYARVIREKTRLTPEESFELIRSIRKQAKRTQKHITSAMIIAIFILFWLIGALIFRFTEDWRYFDAMYFCFLCLITIGYGDYTLKSAAGRAIFVVWAVSAVPLMTILISNVGDLLYELAVSSVRSRVITKIFLPASNSSKEDLNDDNDANLLTSTSEDQVDQNSSQRSIDEILDEASANQRQDKELRKGSDHKEILEAYKRMTINTHSDPDKIYNFHEWKVVIDLLDLQEHEEQSDNGLFWISADSPLRLPIRESNYLQFILFHRLEQVVLREAEYVTTRTSSSSNRTAAANVML